MKPRTYEPSRRLRSKAKISPFPHHKLFSFVTFHTEHIFHAEHSQRSFFCRRRNFSWQQIVFVTRSLETCPMVNGNLFLTRQKRAFRQSIMVPATFQFTASPLTRMSKKRSHAMEIWSSISTRT